MEGKLPMCNHLTDEEYKLFLKVFSDHNSSMGLKERQDYTLADVLKVVSELDKGYLMVYYRNGNWWHYTVNGTLY